MSDKVRTKSYEELREELSRINPKDLVFFDLLVEGGKKISLIRLLKENNIAVTD